MWHDSDLLSQAGLTCHANQILDVIGLLGPGGTFGTDNIRHSL